MWLLTLHCFFLTLMSGFYMFSSIFPYLPLLFSHFVFLFSPSFPYSSRQETHSTIYNVSFDFIATCPKYYGDKKYFIVPEERNNVALIYSQTKYFNIIIFGTKYKSFTPFLSTYFLFSFWSGCISFFYYFFSNCDGVVLEIYFDHKFQWTQEDLNCESLAHAYEVVT